MQHFDLGGDKKRKGHEIQSSAASFGLL
jgi:hypothetical protein